MVFGDKYGCKMIKKIVFIMGKRVIKKGKIKFFEFDLLKIEIVLEVN